MDTRCDFDNKCPLCCLLSEDQFARYRHVTDQSIKKKSLRSSKKASATVSALEKDVFSTASSECEFATRSELSEVKDSVNSLARDIKEFIATFGSDRFPSPGSRTSEDVGNLRETTQTVNDSASPPVVSLTTMAPSVVSATVGTQRQLLQITDLDVDNIQLLTTSATLSTQSLPGTLTTATDNSSHPLVLDGSEPQPASTSMGSLDTAQHKRSTAADLHPRNAAIDLIASIERLDLLSVLPRGPRSRLMCPRRFPVLQLQQLPVWQRFQRVMVFPGTPAASGFPSVPVASSSTVIPGASENPAVAGFLPNPVVSGLQQTPAVSTASAVSMVYPVVLSRPTTSLHLGSSAFPAGPVTVPASMGFTATIGSSDVPVVSASTSSTRENSSSMTAAFPRAPESAVTASDLEDPHQSALKDVLQRPLPMNPIIGSMDHYSFSEKLDGLSHLLENVFEVIDNRPVRGGLQRRDTYPTSKIRNCPPADWQEELLKEQVKALADLKYPNKIGKPVLVGEKSYASANPDVPATHPTLNSDFHKLYAKPAEFMSVREGRITEIADSVRSIYNITNMMFWLLRGYHVMLHDVDEALKLQPHDKMESKAEHVIFQHELDGLDRSCIEGYPSYATQRHG